MTARAGISPGALGAPALPGRGAYDRVPTAAAGTVVGGAGLIGAAVAFGSNYALLMVVALLGLAGLVVLLVWSELALPLAVFLIWTNFPTVAVLNGAPGLVAIAVPLILVIPMATSFLRGQMLTIDRIFLYLLALLGVFIASTMVSPTPDIGAEQTKGFILEGIILYFLVFNVIRSPGALRRAAFALLAAGAFLAAITVFQNLTHTYYKPYFGFSPLDLDFFLGKGSSPRAYGPVGDPNYYAQILVATIGVGLPILWRERQKVARMFVAVCVALCTAALAFTFSRGGILALAIVMIAMVVLGFLRLRHLAAMALVLAVLISIVPGYRDRILSLTKLGGVTAQTGASNEADDAARNRLTENLAAILVFIDYPMLGVGPGAFVAYYQEYAKKTGGPVHQSKKRDTGGLAAGEAPKREAHNIFLSAAAETGLLGLVALLAVLCTALSQVTRARRRWRDADPGTTYIMAGLSMALIGYVAAGLFLSLAFERYLWLLLALMGASAFVARDQMSRRAR